MMRKIIFLLLIAMPSMIFPQEDCKVTYVSNEGFIIESDGKKVLIDALFNKIDGNWCDSPSDSIIELMKGSEPPFDNVDIIAITHKHIDHFDESIVVSHLLSNPKGMLICPEQVDEILSGNIVYEKFSDRIISITPEMYHDTNIIVSNIPVRILRLEHSHYIEEDSISGMRVNRHRNIENLGYVFRISDITIFHSGDTNPLNEKEYSTFALDDEDIDIAFLERMFFSAGEMGINNINSYIKPDNIVLMHINPGNKDLFINHFKKEKNIRIFENKMESTLIACED